MKAGDRVISLRDYKDNICEINMNKPYTLSQVSRNAWWVELKGINHTTFPPEWFKLAPFHRNYPKKEL